MTGLHGRVADGSPSLFIRAAFLVIVLLSVGNFQPALTGASEADALQQVIVLAAWLLIIFVSYVAGARQSRPTLNGLLWPILFYAYAMISPAWSSNPAGGLQKSIAFLITTFGAWRLVGLLRPRQFFDLLYVGFFALIVLSMLLVRFAPHIGVLSTWQHSGQWSGPFVSKQVLGAAAAFLVTIALLRLSERKRMLDVAALAAGLMCLVGSGSRGGAVIAVAAVACVLLARRSRMASIAVAYVPLAATALATATLTHLASTGRDYIMAFGSRIDLTERTLIWQYGLKNWLGQPTFGFGLSGFWSDVKFYDGFQKQHGWVLDNFHSGYNTILIELGLVGLMAFAAVTIKLCRRVSQGGGRSDSYESGAMLSFLVLFYVINLTETFLLRSTSAFQITFTYVLFVQFARAFKTQSSVAPLVPGAGSLPAPVSRKPSRGPTIMTTSPGLSFVVSEAGAGLPSRRRRNVTAEKSTFVRGE